MAEADQHPRFASGLVSWRLALEYLGDFAQVDANGHAEPRLAVFHQSDGPLDQRKKLGIRTDGLGQRERQGQMADNRANQGGNRQCRDRRRAMAAASRPQYRRWCALASWQ